MLVGNLNVFSFNEFDSLGVFSFSESLVDNFNSEDKFIQSWVSGSLDGPCLSRGGNYYHPSFSLRRLFEDSLCDDLMYAVEYSRCKLVRWCLGEHILNFNLALLDMVLKSTLLADPISTSIVEHLTHNVAKLSACSVGAEDIENLGEVLNALGVDSETLLRSHREFDHPMRIENEVDIVKNYIMQEIGATVFIVPMYGASRLYARLKSQVLDVTVIPVVVSMHEYAHQIYYESGIELAQRIVPPDFVVQFIDLCRDGVSFLIIDDNVGYGGTVSIIRGLVNELGGVPFVRCAETAWHIFERDPSHCLNGILDFPSCRRNIHHSITHSFAQELVNGTAESYNHKSKLFASKFGPQIVDPSVFQNRWNSEANIWLRREYEILADLSE